MRDVIAGLVALLLLLAAASLATGLSAYRRRRQRARDSERALGRRIIVELPGGGDLVLVSEDDVRFYWGDQTIDKDLIVAVTLLVNGSPIAVRTARRFVDRPAAAAARRGGAEQQPDAFARDQWDVEVVTLAGTTVIPCGAIRERVSQELARTLFEAMAADIAARDR
jgi:hypothetical protein